MSYKKNYLLRIFRIATPTLNYRTLATIIRKQLSQQQNANLHPWTGDLCVPLRLGLSSWVCGLIEEINVSLIDEFKNLIVAEEAV